MNYRLLLTEMLIDYTERKSLLKCNNCVYIYDEIIRDLTMALEIEFKMQEKINKFKEIINNNE